MEIICAFVVLGLIGWVIEKYEESKEQNNAENSEKPIVIVQEKSGCGCSTLIGIIIIVSFLVYLGNR